MTRSSHRGDHAIELYLRQIAKIPLLSREQEKSLAWRIVRARRAFRRVALGSGFAWPLALKVARQVLAGERGFDGALKSREANRASRTAARERLPALIQIVEQRVEECRRRFRASRAPAADLSPASPSAGDEARRAFLQARSRVVSGLERLQLRTRHIRAALATMERAATLAREAGRRLQQPAGLAPEERRRLVRRRRAVQIRGSEGLARLELRCRQARACLAAYRQATGELTSANLRLVVSIVKRYRYDGVCLSDLVQEGNTGLMRAAEKFDPRRGIAFSTYATWWVRQSVTQMMARRARRVPLNQSLDLPEDEQGAPFANCLVDPRATDPAEAAAGTALRRQLDTVLQTLTEREREIVRWRYGLIDGVPRSLKDLAERFQISCERVRQLEHRALARLRTPRRAMRLEEFLTPSKE